MLLEERRSLESRCPRRWLWLTAGGLLAFAVVLSGVGPTTSAVRADDKKPDEKQADKPEKKKDDEKKEEKLDKPKNDKPADKPDKPKVKRSTGSDLFDKLLEQIPADLDPAQAKMIRDQLEAARKQMEQAMNLKDRVIWGQNRFPGGPVIVGRGNQEPRLGLMLAIPSSTLAEQLDLPKGQGLVVENVIKDSPAARAGMKPNDVLLELAGKAVTDRPDQLVKQVQALEPNKPVDAVVLRKGKKETVKGLTLPEVRKANVPAKPNVSESSLNLSRTGDSFNLTSREGAKSIVMRGKVVDGKAQLANVTITDGKVRGSYESLDKVPAEHQEAVKALLALCEAGKTKKP